MNKKIFIVLLIPFFLVQCSYYYKFFKEESEFFSKGELLILTKTTEAIGYNYSFDPDLKLDYIYSNAPDIELAKKKQKDFYEALKSFSKGDITSFYNKIYRLKLILTYTMKEAEEDKDWNDYTLIKKYIMPGFTIYYDMLERFVFKIAPEHKEAFAKKKPFIDAKVKDDFD